MFSHHLLLTDHLSIYNMSRYRSTDLLLMLRHNKQVECIALISYVIISEILYPKDKMSELI